METKSRNKTRHERGTIREQLLEKGVKESPVAYVERLFRRHQELMAQPIWSEWFKRKLKVRITHLQNKIQRICKDRNIGDPFNGQKIEWLKQKQYGDKKPNSEGNARA